ncbi:uncharacterized protein N7515_006081 [Penicillium bovifimosum]|uniref:DUF7924 domain-containing protein n=1 Tax=Penicillium bovifimosum TaxID=126998 RepID=A0A9W9GU57_9EURO|nr:uncharacterized protein N7515_006081 [Penicillium bovifimosum]KAJ5130042.1 hypothetical protein N7515_006081 [Penicillium bovifimosum]
MSDKPSTPDPATGEGHNTRRSSLKSASTPATPERPSVTFANPLQPQSPGSVGSAKSGASNVTYKSRIYPVELEMRGIIESKDSPPWLDRMTKVLERRKGTTALHADTIASFLECLRVPGNEATIQTVVVPPLMKLAVIMTNPSTHAAVEAQFVSECRLPLPSSDAQGISIKNIPPPYPDITVGLRRENFYRYKLALYDLGDVAAPISCTTDMLFPCFTLEVKGDVGYTDAQHQNRHNAAVMLFHLRQLSTRARGEEVTRQSFDNAARVLSAIVSQGSITISAHWTTSSQGSDNISFLSHLLKSIDTSVLTHEQWNEVSRWLQNAVNFVVKETQEQLERDLRSINDEILKRGEQTTSSTSASSTRKRRREEIED